MAKDHAAGPRDQAFGALYPSLALLREAPSLVIVGVRSPVGETTKCAVPAGHRDYPATIRNVTPTSHSAMPT